MSRNHIAAVRIFADRDAGAAEAAQLALGNQQQPMRKGLRGAFEAYRQTFEEIDLALHAALRLQETVDKKPELLRPIFETLVIRTPIKQLERAAHGVPGRYAAVAGKFDECTMVKERTWFRPFSAGSCQLSAGAGKAMTPLARTIGRARTLRPGTRSPSFGGRTTPVVSPTRLRRKLDGCLTGDHARRRQAGSHRCPGRRP